MIILSFCFRLLFELVMTESKQDEINVTVAGVLQHLKNNQTKLKESQRKAEIKAELLSYKTEAAKRNIQHNKECLFKIEDLKDVFPIKEGEDVITADNISESNEALKFLLDCLAKLEEKFQHEYDMQVVAATSPLGWQAVRQLEGGLELPGTVSITNAEVRKAEKDSMAYARDLRSAQNANKKRRAEWYEDNAENGQGGAVRGIARGNDGTCWTCGSSEHRAKDCTAAKE